MAVIQGLYVNRLQSTPAAYNLFNGASVDGLLLERTIYYYPPPREIARMASLFTSNYSPTITMVTVVLIGLLYLGSLVFDRDISRIWYILSTAYSLFLKLKFL